MVDRAEMVAPSSITTLSGYKWSMMTMYPISAVRATRTPRSRWKADRRDEDGRYQAGRRKTTERRRVLIALAALLILSSALFSNMSASFDRNRLGSPEEGSPGVSPARDF